MSRSTVVRFAPAPDTVEGGSVVDCIGSVPGRRPDPRNRVLAGAPIMVVEFLSGGALRGRRHCTGRDSCAGHQAERQRIRCRAALRSPPEGTDPVLSGHLSGFRSSVVNRINGVLR